MKVVRMSNIQLCKIIVRCEQRDGPPRPSAHHVTGRLKEYQEKNNSGLILSIFKFKPMFKQHVHLLI